VKALKFICETCGKEVLPEEGTLSWVDGGNSLHNFKITHKDDQNHSCDPKHVGYIHLWIVTGLTGFTKFTEILADYWEKGYTLKDSGGLKKALNQVGLYIWEKTKKATT
jgi:hypothetical protein